MKNYYKVLGVPQSASVAEIKKAYSLLAQQYDPSRNKGDEYVEERFIDISLAYKTLIDVEKRRDYDKILTDILRESEEELKSVKRNSEHLGQVNSNGKGRWLAAIVLVIVAIGATLYYQRNNNVVSDDSPMVVIDTLPAVANKTITDTLIRRADTIDKNTANKGTVSPVEPEKVKEKEQPKAASAKIENITDTTIENISEHNKPTIEEEYVYVGANKSYVLDVQGTPSSITRYGARSEEWHYGSSVINFVDNKVVRIRNNDNNLKVK